MQDSESSDSREDEDDDLPSLRGAMIAIAIGFLFSLIAFWVKNK